MWWMFWDVDKNEGMEERLSSSDKHWLLYWNFLTCMVMVAFVLLAVGINTLWVRHQNNKDMDAIIDTIAVYMASATRDEYDEIAGTIRHDLIVSEYSGNMEKFIPYIPNTADNCRTCMESYLAQVYLVCVNTGEIYSLDPFEKCDNPIVDFGGTVFSFGYDEVSQTRLYIAKRHEEKECTAEIECERRIISIHRMKTIFCDDCIQEILNTVEHQLMEAFVLFDAEEKIFYPIEDDTAVQTGNYSLKIEYRSSDYKITIHML